MAKLTIDADPAAIESAGNGLVELGNHMTTKASATLPSLASLTENCVIAVP